MARYSAKNTRSGQARRRREKTRRLHTMRAAQTRIRLEPKFSKTMRTKLIYAHPSGPALRKAIAAMKTKTPRTRRIATVAAMNVNRATGTRRSGRLAGNTVQLVSLNNLPKKTRSRPVMTRAIMNAFIKNFESKMGF